LEQEEAEAAVQEWELEQEEAEAAVQEWELEQEEAGVEEEASSQLIRCESTLSAINSAVRK
jgi:hypothetical protein